MNCFGRKKKTKSGYEKGPKISSEFALKPMFGTDFGINALDLLETIGVGSFSRVRLCRNISENKYYALKIMRKTKLVNLQQVQHVKDELFILSHVQSPFIVDIHAFFQDDNSLFYLLSYICGGELFSHIRKRERLENDTARFIAVEVACGLHALHSYGVVYRGVKPENILLDRLGHVKLVDFGFAKHLGDSKQTFTLCGTPEYLAPEILEGTGYGIASDWWALGILLFEMLAGFPPFFAANPFAVYKNILEGKFKFHSSMNRNSKSVLAELLAIDRSSRLGCSSGGFQSLMSHSYFKGISWESAKKMQIQPILVPTVNGDGDTSNFDFYEEENLEVASNLTSKERELFLDFDETLDRA